MNFERTGGTYDDAVYGEDAGGAALCGRVQ